jgi:hypothetical protein
MLVEIELGLPEGAAQLAIDAGKNATLGVGRLERGELGSNFIDQRALDSQVDRNAPALRVAHDEQKIGAGSQLGAAAPCGHERSLASEQRAMLGDEPLGGPAALVDRIAKFQNSYAIDRASWAGLAKAGELGNEIGARERT